MAVSKSYNVEFNDSLLDLEGWKNPRYEGSKLTGIAVNKFMYGVDPISLQREKTLNNTEDILYPAYGPKPVIENKSTVLFVGNNIQQGGDADIENESIVELKNHSHINIDKIIILNPNHTTGTDAIEEIITKEQVGIDSFNQFIIDNCPEGSRVKVRLLDNTPNNLSTSHYVKFNKGSLMKVYTYTADTASNTDDGVFGGYGSRHNQGVLTNNLASGSLNEGFSTGVGGFGLFGFGMTTAASHSRFTSSITMVDNLPSELSLYNTEITQITELNPLTGSIVINPVEGGDYLSLPTSKYTQ
tara:strand:+ start:443 stop:1342 length:900 start_codon:yes stop_codon:yes gene_type:complete